MAKEPEGYTVWVCENTGGGTHHVSYHIGDVDTAKAAALNDTACDWGQEEEGLHVLGVVAGDVSIIEWNEFF